MKKIAALFTLFLLVQTTFLAQNSATNLVQAKPATSGISEERLALLDAHIQKFVDEGNIPGGVFTLARKGKLVYQKSFGYRTLDKKVAYKPMNSEYIYHSYFSTSLNDQGFYYCCYYAVIRAG